LSKALRYSDRNNKKDLAVFGDVALSPSQNKEWYKPGVLKLGGTKDLQGGHE